MKSRLEVLIGWVLIALGLSLAWPPGRQAYELLAHWGGFNFDWWLWPLLTTLTGLTVLLCKTPQMCRYALWFAGVLFVTVAASVYLSIGANSLTAVLGVMAVFCARAMTDLKGAIRRTRAPLAL